MKLYQIRLIVACLAALSVVLSGILLHHYSRKLPEELAAMDPMEWGLPELVTPEIQRKRMRTIEHDVTLSRLQNKFSSMLDYLMEQLAEALIDLKNPEDKTLEGSEAYVAMQRFLTPAWTRRKELPILSS